MPRCVQGLAIILAALLLGRSPAQEVVVYVSLDEEHSRQILEVFQRETGIKVLPNFDTEDNKTVGLVNRLIAERGAPVADVYWNNECGQSERLRAMGLLEPYRSPHAETIPAAFKDPGGHWTGFAARARVLVWNREKISETELPSRIEELADPKHRGKLAMARPLTGTTLTHVGALYAVLGEPRTNQWLDRLQANEVRWEAGNAQVARVVAEGTRPFGMTDTDDVRVQQLEGAPVATRFLDQGEGALGTFIIPNSVMLLKGAPHPDQGRALIDFLLSPRVEKMLAAARSAQMPLHPGIEVPDHVTPVGEIQAMTIDFAAVGRMLEAHKDGLAARFLAATPGGPTGEEKRGFPPLAFALGALLLAIVFVTLALRPRRGKRRDALAS